LKSDWLALSVDQLPVMREEEDAPSNATKWDRRFLAVASVVASWSKDPGTKVGAVIADPAKRRIVSTGYNGVPRNMEDVNLDDRVSKLQRTIHAEMNAILNSCERLDGHTLYVSSLPPCER